MEILSSLDLKKGKRSEQTKSGSITQPVQFLPREEKDESWVSSNADWLEWRGMAQLRNNARRLMKNFKLAKGIIDKSDYIVAEENDYRDLIETLVKEDESALELKFYPIIPNVINTLCSEFAKRNTGVTFRGTDEFSYNELLEQKRSQIEQTLLATAEQKLMMNMVAQGLDENDPQVQEQMQQQLSPENLKSLPEIQKFFEKDYRSMVEQWAQHQHKVDVDRFHMDELEETAFRNMLITDREFWHFKMLSDDYDVELWNPVLTYYHKAPETRYISNGLSVGKIEMMTVADVVDKYGAIMTKEQLEAVEAIYPIRSAGYPVTGYQNDGAHYDATKSHEWNTDLPGLAYRQFVSMSDNFGSGSDIVSLIMKETEDYTNMGFTFLLRVSTNYWKSQRKLGHLTRIKESGEVVVDIVDESYIVTDKPVYNNTLIKNKNKDTLIFGEHIDWIWINQTWGVVKVGPNHPSWWGMKSAAGSLSPMYLGIDQNMPGPLKFQFKGDDSLYGCKLPVEGRVFSDYNTRSTSLVDLMKPFQVGFNIVNNQIADILVDELGTIIVFDQNALPRHSLGEDWGKNNYAKAFVAMKNFQMLPLDRSVGNMEGANGQAPLQQLNLEQTQRLMTRIQLANYFKQEAFATIGVNQQRMGQPLGRQTATEVEENLGASYAQTEMYFIQHADYLMPRVHQMRTDLAQYYQSTKSSVRLQYMTTNDEAANFEINGADLLLRDLNIYPTTKAVHRELLDNLKKLAVSNNTAGASIFDLGSVMASGSVAEVNNAMKDIEDKASKARQEERDHEEKIKDMDIQARKQEQMMLLDRQEREAEKTRRSNELIAEIRAAGYGAAVDKNANGQSDFVDYMETLKKTDEFQQTMGFENSKEQAKQSLNEDKQAIQREKMSTQLQMKNIDLQIARENKNSAELAKRKKEKESAKKK